MHRLPAFLLAAALCPAGFALDRLTPTTGPVLEGTFLGYEGGSFQLLNRSQETEKKLVAATLELTLDPSREVTVTPRAGKPESMELLRFQKGQFIFKRGGVEAPRPLSLVKKIEVPFSAQMGVDALGAAAANRGEAPPVGSLAETGRTTIVHFHYPKSVASLRQGSLAATLVRDSRGAVALRRIEVPDWTDAAVRQYDLKSLPQFWFYNERGELAAKLVDRFTDEDLTAALWRAQQ